MPHSVESTIKYSERDLARGAIDLVPEDNSSSVNISSVAINQNMLEAAVSVVKEAGPKVIEAIVTHLVPVSRPQKPEAFMNVSAGSGDTIWAPEVFASPPLETIVIVPSANHSVPPPIVTNRDTVNIYL
jgi:hypothetical protein